MLHSRREAMITELPRTTQAVEKVVVGPVSGPKEARKKAKTLRKRHFQSSNRGAKSAQRSFSTRWCGLGDSELLGYAVFGDSFKGWRSGSISRYDDLHERSRRTEYSDGIHPRHRLVPALGSRDLSAGRPHSNAPATRSCRRAAP